MDKRGNKNIVNAKDKTISKNIFDKNKTKPTSPHKTKHHVWLIATISLAIIVILFLAFYTQIRVAVVGKAMFGGACTINADCDEGVCVDGICTIGCSVKPSCTFEENMIMSLNRENNAHGYSLYAATQETIYKLCCSGMDRVLSSDQTCPSDSVPLLYLNRENNAHASATQNPEGIYTKPICVSGVSQCKLVQSPGYEFVIGLNRNYNAHLYEDGYAGNGGVNIYCKPLITVPSEEVEICDNNQDDDDDGFIDCHDPDCAESISPEGRKCCTNPVHCPETGSMCNMVKHECFEFLCNNDFDDDEDGLKDCDDTDCEEHPACVAPEEAECTDDQDCPQYFTCSQGSCEPGCQQNIHCSSIHNLEGHVCENRVCIPAPLEETICYDNEDNDEDGYTDCADSDCNGQIGDLVPPEPFTQPQPKYCQYQTESTCDDNFDNDADGDVDCDDTNCEPVCFVEICTDGEDNDGDGLADCLDNDCQNKRCGLPGSACRFETCKELDCNDDIDNDGNGLIDCDDPDCATYQGCVEAPLVLLGDVNGDGVINVLDIIDIAAHITGLTLLDPNDIPSADADCDDQINVLDIIRIVEAIVNTPAGELEIISCP